MLQRTLENQPAAYQGLAALLVCSLAAMGAGQWTARTERSLEQLQAARSALEQRNAAEAQPATAAVQAQPQTPAQWPLRQSLDAVVQQASQEAVRRGLVVRSLSVSHQAGTPSAWGKVNLEVSTTGTYAASKAWQSGLMQAFPALAVQSLRLQSAPGSSGGLDAQWTWVLHVRD